MEQAFLREVESRCTQEDPPYCQAACPLHLDVRAFMLQMQGGNFQAARTVLERHLPFPAILGRVCDHPCENSCLRKDLGGSLAIGALERACVTLAPQAGRVLPRLQKTQRLAVLGAGPAGLTVAWDLSAKGYTVSVFHDADDKGAVLRSLFPEELLPAEIIAAELERLEKRSVTFQKQILSNEFLSRASQEFDGVFIDVSCAAACCSELSIDENALNPVTGSMDDNHGLCFGGWPQSFIAVVAEGRRGAVTLERYFSGASVTAAREREGVSGSRLYTPLEGVKALARVVPGSIPADASVSGGIAVSQMSSVPGAFFNEISSGSSVTATCSEQEAVAESGRCLRCQCMACVRECAYLEHYKGYPKTYARQIYNNAAIVKGHHLSNTMINSCTLCGQCQAICPEDFSMADLCLTARREMVEKGYMPPSAHEFALEDMAVSNGPDCALLMPPPFSSDPSCIEPSGSKTAALPDAQEHLLFPGCQLAASRGNHIIQTLKHLNRYLSGGVGIWLSCCGIPAHWSGRESLFAETLGALRQQWTEAGKPRLIMACASCLKIFREAAPEILTVSLWEVLESEAPLPLFVAAADQCNGRGNSSDNDAGNAVGDILGGKHRENVFNKNIFSGKTLVLHDPCTTRHNIEWLNAVRTLLQRHGIEVVEPRLTRETTPCCGYGGLVWSANPEMGGRMVTRLAEGLKAAINEKPSANDSGIHDSSHVHDSVVSCIMCRDRLVGSGTRAWHLLDILLPSLVDAAVEQAGQRAPGLSARRANRAALKRRILREFYARELPEPGAEPGAERAAVKPLEIIIPDEVLAQMEQRHILSEDARRVVLAAESGGQRFSDGRNGHFLATLRPSRVTYWVEYSKSGATCLVHDAYCHRMVVPGVTAATPDDQLSGSLPVAASVSSSVSGSSANPAYNSVGKPISGDSGYRGGKHK